MNVNKIAYIYPESSGSFFWNKIALMSLPRTKSWNNLKISLRQALQFQEEIAEFIPSDLSEGPYSQW